MKILVVGGIIYINVDEPPRYDRHVCWRALKDTCYGPNCRYRFYMQLDMVYTAVGPWGSL